MNDLEFVIDFPTLGDIADQWITAHCRVPDGFTRGKPMSLADWQFWCTANRYRIRPDAVFVHPDDVGPDDPPVLNQAFVYRQTLVIAPQKTGKGPWSAAQVAFEAAGPSVFAGWAEGGEVYACADNGCDCGWEYAYEAGDAMGMRHPSPLIQITATSEDQADNIYRPLRAMIKLGPLKNMLAVREGFIRILGMSGDDDLDRIDVVTASANSRLGNPISDAEQDEVGLYTKTNRMIAVAETQRRGAAGMGGRTHATTNAPDPSQNSYAQQIMESGSEDVFIFYRNPDDALRDKDGKLLRYSRKADRQKIHEYVYAGSWWVNLDSIEAEAAELMKTDPAQAERFFGNRVVAGSGRWLGDGVWDSRKADPVISVKPRTRVCLGFDGSDNNDWTGIRLETLDYYQFTPTYIDDRKTLWRPAEWGGRVPRAGVNAAVDRLANEFEIIRAYCDPHMWETEIDEWAAKYGDKVFIKWQTSSVVKMHASLERFLTDITDDETRFRHDGDKDASIHANNAVKRARPGERYILGKASEHQKIDVLMSSALAHEAACDAIAAGWKPEAPTSKVRVWR
jgi:hypothetical protein